MFGLFFHHHEYTTSFKLPNGCRRVHSSAIAIELDEPVNTRYPWLFRGLSVSRVNDVLESLSAMKNKTYKTMDEEDIKTVCTPYDAMHFKTPSGEDLFVAYSIAGIQHPFRNLIIGPENVSLYEKDVPHFGPIFVFRATMEHMDDHTTFHMNQIESSVDEILTTLEGLNFGG